MDGTTQNFTNSPTVAIVFCSAPAGWVQMYLQDPAGNLIEVDWPDASTLDRSVIPLTQLSELHEQTGDAARATLYVDAPVRL